MEDFSRKWGVTIFNFGVGYFLLNTELPLWGQLGISAFFVVLGLLAIAQFGQIASFWSIADSDPVAFGPDGEYHERSKVMFDRTILVTYDFQSQEKFWLSLGCSIVLMAGLLHQGMYTALVFEFAASVLGYSVIRAFLTNFPHYYSLVKGKGLQHD